MIRQFPWRRLVLSTLCLVSLGCEPHHSWLRHNNDDELSSGRSAMAVESDASKIPAVDSDAKNSKPFFSNDRSSGGWSSQAREIESHLGVGN
jgi:hypothetical protein